MYSAAANLNLYQMHAELQVELNYCENTMQDSIISLHQLP